MPIKFILYISIAFLSLSCKDSTESKAKDKKPIPATEKKELKPHFNLVFEDSIGYGCRGMEFFEGEVYFSGIKGTFFKINMDLKPEVLLEMENDSLDFRDILVLGKDEFLAINSGLDLGFILHYKKGKTDTVYKATHEGNFLDDLAQDENGNIYCLGDPTTEDRTLFLLKSADKGKTWSRIYEFVNFGEDEFFFAASGSCMLINKDTIYLAVGGNKSYVMRLLNDHPGIILEDSKIPAGESSGINAMIMSEGTIYTVGGDYGIPGDSSITFHKLGWDEISSKTGGYQSTISKDKDLLVCSGRNGTYYSKDDGKSWVKFLDEEFYKVIAMNNHLYCSGPKGKIKIFEVSHATD